MHRLYNNKIPFSFRDKFTKLEQINLSRPENLAHLNFFLPCVFKIARQKKLEFGGAKLWKSLDENLKSKKIIKKVFYNFSKIHKLYHN